MSDPDWNDRQLCDDGACIGVIGADGVCKVCGKASAFWGDERRRGQRSADVVAEAEAADEDADPAELAAAPLEAAPDDLDERQLCSDGACIGVIGDDGKCKVCGLPAEP